MARFVRNRAPNITDVDGYSVNDRWTEAPTGRGYRLESIVGGAAYWEDVTKLEGAVRCTPPCPHSHTADELSGVGGGGSVDWGDVQNKPAEFPPSAHTHLQADVSGLASALAAKVEGNDPRLSDARNPLAHSHAIADTTGLQAALNGKAPSSHSHAESEITGLVADLAAKQATVEKGQANGYAGLGADGKVPAAQLPASGGGMTKVVLGADVTNNNAVANTLQDVTGLAFPVVSGQRYRFRFVIYYTAAATTTGSRWSINGPANTVLRYGSEYTLTATSRTFNEGLTGYNVPAASNATSIIASNKAVIEGVITPSANGNVIARFASEVANSAIVAKAGSFVEFEAY